MHRILLLLFAVAVCSVQAGQLRFTGSGFPANYSFGIYGSSWYQQSPAHGNGYFTGAHDYDSVVVTADASGNINMVLGDMGSASQSGDTQGGTIGIDTANSTDVTGGGSFSHQVYGGSSTLTFQFWNNCPDRTGIVFKLNYNIATSANYQGGPVVFTLEVNNTQRFSTSVNIVRNSGGVIGTLTTYPMTISGSGQWRWKANGVVVSSGEYYCSTELPNGITGSANMTVSNPGTTTTDQSTTTSTGSGGTTTTTSSTTSSTGSGGVTTSTATNATTTVNNGGTSMSNASNQDFYNDVRQALMDAGNSGTSGPLSMPGIDLEGVDTSEDGGFDQLQGIGDAAKEARDAAQQSLKAQVQGLNNKVAMLPTTFGTVGSISFGTLAGTEIVVPLDSGPVGSKIPLVRLAMLWVFSVLWLAMCINAIRQYL